MPSIVEILKKFKNILLGHNIVAFADEQKLTQDDLGYTSERVMRWQLLVEEFGPDIEYIEGKDNSVAAVISILNYSGESLPSDTVLSLEKLFTFDKNDMELFPVSFQVIVEAQEGCADLQDWLKDENNNVY
eukprot:10807591-Ditylum_brightwellii.AAC.1